MADPVFVAALPRTISEARRTGSAYYYSKSCKYGHNAYRRLSDGACAKCSSLHGAQCKLKMGVEKVRATAQKSAIRYMASEKGQITRREYKSSEIAKTNARVHRSTDKHKANRRAYRASEHGVEVRRKLLLRDPKLSWAKVAINGAKRRALGKGLMCDLTVEYLYAIIPDNCPAFGTAFSFIENKKTTPTSPSLDRIIPALGYVKGNVAVISHLANTIKSYATAEEIQKVADWLFLAQKPVDIQGITK